MIGTDEEKAAAKARLEHLEERIAEATRAIKDSEVVLTLRAISSERYDELVDQSREKYPLKYEKVSNPLTGRTTMEELASPDRDEYFTDLFLGEVIVRATVGNDVDDQIDGDWFAQFKKYAPVDAVRVVVGKAFKMRMVSQWMDTIQDEDFSPRP